jgi:hypothetical protein
MYFRTAVPSAVGRGCALCGDSSLAFTLTAALVQLQLLHPNPTVQVQCDDSSLFKKVLSNIRPESGKYNFRLCYYD